MGERIEERGFARVERAVLFAFAALLPLHTLFTAPVVGRAAPGDLLFLVAAAIVVVRHRSFARDRALLAPFALVAVLFLPSVGGAADRAVAATQLAILLYVTMLFALGAKATRDGHGNALRMGFVSGVVANALLGLFGVMALIAFHLPNHFSEITGAYGTIANDAPLTMMRATGATEGANMLAAQIVAAAFVLLGSPKRGAREYAALVILVAVLPFTAGHVMLAGVTALCVYAATITAGRRRAYFGALATGVASVLVLFTIARGLPLSAHAPFFDLRPSPYLLCHATALSELRAHPITGVGLEHFARAWPSYVDRALEARVFEGMDSYVGTAWDPHSTYLGFAAEGGAFGVVALGALTVLLLRARHATVREYLGLATFALLAAFVLDVLTNREIALGLGLLFALPKRKQLAARVEFR
jgi:hypothetical protein